jgi:hypothetical protein
MRAYFEAVEAGSPLVRSADIEARLAREDLAAVRAAGLLRPTGRDPYEEVSLPDLARMLRALYDVESRGLPVPIRFDSQPAPLGWIHDADGDRSVMLFVGPHFSLPRSFRAGTRALVLLPTARKLSDALRAKYPPGGYVAIDVLDEALSVRDGRIVRANAVAPLAPALSTPPPASAPAPSPARAPDLAPARASRRIAGAERWNVIRIALVDQHTVRIDLPGVSVRRTYLDLGMAHPVHRRPKRTWQLLVELCEQQGAYLGTAFGSADATKKLVSRLGAELCDVFGLRETPFHPYRPKEGWKAKFQATPKVREWE